jgi:hypothetical protein
LGSSAVIFSNVEEAFLESGSWRRVATMVLVTIRLLAEIVVLCEIKYQSCALLRLWFDA